MKRLFSFLLSLLFVSPVFSADALLLTDLGSSARMIALGGIEGFSWDANTVFETPSSLYRVPRRSVSAFTTHILDEVTYINLGYVQKTQWGRFGLGYMSAGVDDIPFTATDSQNRFFAEHYFGYTNQLIKAAYQNQLSKNWFYGVGLNFYSAAFNGITSNGFNSDVGLSYDKDPYRLAIAAKNILTGSKANYSDGSSETYPFQLQLSGQYHFWDLELMGQLKTSQLRDTPLQALGLVYHPIWLPFLQLNAGMKQFYALKRVETSHTIGLGFSYYGFQFDYAYESSVHPNFTNYNYFSASLSF